jgi:hypothetical protein
MLLVCTIIVAQILAAKASAPAPRLAAAPRPPVVKPMPAPPVRPATPTAPRTPAARNNNRSGMRQVTNNTDYSITLHEHAKIRKLDLPEEFDDKGIKKKLTAEQLKQYKGDTAFEKKLDGYKADNADIKVGDNLKITMYTFKPFKQKPAGKSKEETDKKEDVDKKEEKKNGAEKNDSKKSEPDDFTDEEGKWVPSGVLRGKVTKVDARTGSQRFTVRVTTTTQEPVQVRVSQPNPQAATKNQVNEVDPEHQRAGIVVIAKRGDQPISQK